MNTIDNVVRDAVARAAAVIGLAGIALIHLLDIPGKFQDTPYMGVLYVMLIVGTVAVAGALWRRSDPRAWAAGGALALATIAAFVWSRTIGLPQGGDDIGNWSESLGIASLFVEGSVVALSGAVLAGHIRWPAWTRQRGTRSSVTAPSTSR